MECVAHTLPPSPFLPSHRQLQSSHRFLGFNHEPWMILKHPPEVIRRSALFISAPAPPVRNRTANAVVDFCFIAAAPPAKSGDISVFLQTSAVLLGTYWVANFLVPDLISKYFGFEKAGIGNEDDQNKPKEEDNSIKEARSSSQRKGRGFNSTKN
ncbi:hypothetical protein SAY86_004347 [Trapa natans]|uniref:Uncharacterized protein n=1 Tax=Trapa natans TaxID=22666 RepID=A0AAN7RIS5_TRANT|nr:hypothetical protein SAY86_004347 [Trapa natans]